MDEVRVSELGLFAPTEFFYNLKIKVLFLLLRVTFSSYSRVYSNTLISIYLYILIHSTQRESIMNTENAILMKMARESLQDRWACYWGIFFKYDYHNCSAVHPLFRNSCIHSYFGPLLLGLSLFILSISRDEEAYLEQLFEGFKNAGTATAANIITGVIIMIGLVLLIIPGIIAALSLSMTFYIIADDDSIGVLDAIKK